MFIPFHADLSLCRPFSGGKIQLSGLRSARQRGGEVSWMQKFIARQPILDRAERVYGYELLFRGGEEDFFRGGDPEQASASVISDSILLLLLR